MRCPTQQLRAGRRSDHWSPGRSSAASGQGSSEDFLSEVGEYRSSELGGPHHYSWQQAQTLQLTVAVTGQGAEGRTKDEIDAWVSKAQGVMLSRLENAVEKRN